MHMAIVNWKSMFVYSTCCTGCILPVWSRYKCYSHSRETDCIGDYQWSLQPSPAYCCLSTVFGSMDTRN
ncbi:hypothetical protein WMY93_031006 [Mugilogobius chulae]|uniref:Secreted protein n=1 Tax=Mugilogobius chulae TaxID=88201 RepID=A0AAW0MHE5_9GOBI